MPVSSTFKIITHTLALNQRWSLIIVCVFYFMESVLLQDCKPFKGDTVSCQEIFTKSIILLGSTREAKLIGDILGVRNCLVKFQSPAYRKGR
jgi:hypothetical protein